LRAAFTVGDDVGFVSAIGRAFNGVEALAFLGGETLKNSHVPLAQPGIEARSKTEGGAYNPCGVMGASEIARVERGRAMCDERAGRVFRLLDASRG
jgi:hypothetical protein